MSTGPPSSSSIGSWLSRIDDVTAAVQELLTADPMEELQQQHLRSARRQEEAQAAAAAKLERVKMRYEPKHYSRYERDDVIDALLRAVDEEGTSSLQPQLRDESLYSTAERVSLTEAQRLKQEGATRVQAGDWAAALALYTTAIHLRPPDPALDAVLHNNRAHVHNKLCMHMEAMEDASVVLQHDPRNVKALLRRAVALRQLHRPAEALGDVELVLKAQPRNEEALAQQVVLRRAEAELLRSDAFLVQEQAREGNGRGVNRAGQLCKALELLEGDAADPAPALTRCLSVVSECGEGAAVLFAVRGGVATAMPIAAAALQASLPASRDPQVVVTALAATRLLSVALQECEVATQQVANSTITDLVNALLQLTLRDGGANAADRGDALLSERLMAASLQCLAAMCRFHKVLVQRALEAEESTLQRMWKAAEDAPVCQYAYVVLLEALLKGPAPLVGGGTSTLGQQLFGRDRAEGQALVLTAVRSSLHVQVQAPLQSISAALALRLTSLRGVLGGDDSGAAVVAVLEALSGEAFTLALAALLASTLTRAEARLVGLSGEGTRGKAATPTRWLCPSDSEYGLLEALLSILYNLMLQAKARDAYVRQWLQTSPSVAVRISTWLLNHRVDQPPLCSLSAKALGVLVKFLAIDTELQEALPHAEAHLWEWWRVAAAGPNTARRSVTAECGGPTAWHHVEHLSTLLATSYTRQYISLSADSQLAAHLVDVLLPTVASAKPPTEAAILLAEEDPTAARETTAALVALGNSALLFSHGVPVAAADDGLLANTLEAAKSVDIILTALRDTRTAALLLARERAAREGTPVVADAQLKLWLAHAKAAQRNLAIAMSKVCGVSEVLRGRLRDLNGFETLMAVQNQ